LTVAVHVVRSRRLALGVADLAAPAVGEELLLATLPAKRLAPPVLLFIRIHFETTLGTRCVLRPGERREHDTEDEGQ
jgi:hypothetical protein